jgi:hypothetical protein
LESSESIVAGEWRIAVGALHRRHHFFDINSGLSA